MCSASVAAALVCSVGQRSSTGVGPEVLSSYAGADLGHVDLISCVQSFCWAKSQRLLKALAAPEDIEVQRLNAPVLMGLTACLSCSHIGPGWEPEGGEGG